MRADAVVTFVSRLGGPMFAHERETLAHVARGIAALSGISFDGDHDPWRHRHARVYFVPDDTLLQDEARRLGIHSPNQFYGGVVPFPFVKTKAITHGLVSPAADRPDGWTPQFADAVREAVLPGYTVFDARDACIAAAMLLARGPVRLKRPSCDGGCGQLVITAGREIGAFVARCTPSELASLGIVLEPDLRETVTRSVGCTTIGPRMMIAYHGIQRTVINNAGASVYGGSHLTCVRGGWDELERLDSDEHTRTAIRQARLYDRAANTCFGLLASRRNYDVLQGVDAAGEWRSGVLEASWRSGGASTAELAAIGDFARDPTLHIVEASAVKAFGRGHRIPPRAEVHFCGDDPQDGAILRYTIKEQISSVEPRCVGERNSATIARSYGSTAADGRAV